MLLDNNKRNPSQIAPSEITPESLFKQRRLLLQSAGLGLAASFSGAALGAVLGSSKSSDTSVKPATGQGALQALEYKKTDYGKGEKLTGYEDVTTYNNYYEFGTGKSDPAIEAAIYKTRPWQISIEGEVKTPKTITIEDLLKLAPLEERIYRMRCVEAWSMVIPWVGLPLSAFIKWAEPTGNAKFVEFITANDPDHMPGARIPILNWPYTEGLRMDEAMHPLSLLAVGLYGKVLPNQNGAPVRLVVPWKYGFKGAKAITRIRFVEKMPLTTWVRANAREYGFYANVNPHVDHPRWTQSSEKPIGAGLFAGRIKTRMFNGYASEVGQLYAGMDLKKFF